MNRPVYRSDLAEWLADLVDDIADGLERWSWRAFIKTLACGAVLGWIGFWVYVIVALLDR